ncbi:hypothetical protein RCL1_005547 [Eukaryota sp. TZLM3-RCL]
MLSAREVLNLTSLGFNASSIKFSTATLDSSAFFTVREEIEGVKHVSIVDLRGDEPAVEKLKMGAESVRMHPTQKILALKADCTLQVYDLEKSKRLLSHKFSAPISLLKWVNSELLVIVTSTSVFHFLLSDTTPQSVFELSEPMKSVQILNYVASSDLQWLCLIGMTQDPSTRRPIGRLQLFSVQKSATQNLEGISAGFITVKSASSAINVFCFLVPGEGFFRFQSIPLGSAPDLTLEKVSAQIDLESSNDFPIGFHVSDALLATVVTKTGVLLLDTTTGDCLSKLPLQSTLFTSFWGEGLVLTGVSTTASIVSIDIDLLQIISSCLEKGMITSAINLAIKSSRNAEMLALLKNAAPQAGKPPVLLLYFQKIMESGLKLNEFESTELVSLCVKQNKLQTIDKYLREDKITPTEELGDAISKVDSKLGLAFYLKSQAHEKVALAFVKLEMYDKLLQYSQRTGYVPDYPKFIAGLMVSDADKALSLANSCAASDPKPSYADLLKIVNLFIKQGLERQATDFLFEVLENTPEEKDLQTRLLEAHFQAGNISVVEKILSQGILSFYDFPLIAKLSEGAGLYHRALQHYEGDQEAQKKVLQKAVLNQAFNSIKIFCADISPTSIPFVVSVLLSSGASDEILVEIIRSVATDEDVMELINIAEDSNRLKILQELLEKFVANGSVTPEIHTALAKIYIVTNNSPSEFLKSNNYYNHLAVGKFAEKRDPRLACEAYKKGLCDSELIAITNEHDLFKIQAKYIVQRGDEDLWASVLIEENEFRSQLIDAVVGIVIPNTVEYNEISVTVGAFMKAELSHELIELLEKVVLQDGPFKDITALQNLLILTAIKADQGRVMDYVRRLSAYDATDIAAIAIKFSLYDEAFVVYQKHGENSLAVSVLLDHLNCLEKAIEFADRTNDHQVFSRLGCYQLENELTEDAIKSFIRANDHSVVTQVVEIAEADNCFDSLTLYLKMCRKHLRDAFVDGSLAFSLAKTNNLIELEELLNQQSCQANWLEVGSRVFSAELYDAAKLIYSSINQYSSLASTLLKLTEYKAALDAARKANSPATYREVCHACVLIGEFKLAQTAGINVVSHPEEVDPLVEFYISNGAHEEMLALLETASGLEKAHSTLFTVLGEMYAQYRPTKLMEHLTVFASRISIHRLLNSCRKAGLWSEVVFLYQFDHDFESACEVMMNHPEAFDHVSFKDFLSKSANVELYYRSVEFYLTQCAEKLSDLLKALPRIDKSRLISLVRSKEVLGSIKEWLLFVQDDDDFAVNQALLELFIEEQDYASIRRSVDNYSNIDLISLARTLQESEVSEFRRIAAFILKKTGRFAKSIELSKRDELYNDCVTTAAASEDVSICEDLVHYFVDNQLHEQLTSALMTCFNFVRPDVVLELAWKNKLFDHAMPFLIQVTRNLSNEVRELKQFKIDAEKKLNNVEEKSTIDEDFNSQFEGGFGFQ